MKKAILTKSSLIVYSNTGTFSAWCVKMPDGIWKCDILQKYVDNEANVRSLLLQKKQFRSIVGLKTFLETYTFKGIKDNFSQALNQINNKKTKLTWN